MIMTPVRTEKLSDQELDQFHQSGYLFPIRLLTVGEALELKEAIQEHLTGQLTSSVYELTDPIRIRKAGRAGDSPHFEYEEGSKCEPHTFPFFFNIWKSDPRFEKVAFNSTIAGFARQLLNTQQVLLMEDNVVVKNGRSQALPWHQDFSYWPLERPTAITAWIALDDIAVTNGGMRVVPGSHLLGERLPVSFGDASPLMRTERPGIAEVPQDPSALGHEVVNYTLQAGEAGFHSAMLWHGSAPNTAASPRCAYVIRYLAAGTIWLGALRFPYDDIGCDCGQPINESHFPKLGPLF